MKKALKVIAISLGLVVWGLAPAIAAFSVHNSDIATGAVDSRTIADRSVRWADYRLESVNNKIIETHGVSYGNLSLLALANLQKQPTQGGVTLRGAIGGDFPATTTGPSTDCPNNCSWAGYASLPFPATHELTDADVLVDVSSWVCGDNPCDQTQPVADSSEAASAATCTGTAAAPTAPAGKVCIYVAGGDNAEDVAGYGVIPGSSSGSKYGFKLHWVSTGPGNSNNTFIDAVWAYTAD
jgi:hypothetical protein